MTGIWRPLPDDPIWLGDRLDLTGIDSNATLTYRGPFMVSPADMLVAGRFRQLDLHWRAVPSWCSCASTGSTRSGPG